LPIYLKYKGIQKEMSTYGEDFLRNNLNPVTGRIHSEYFQLADTGRITSSNPNLQNIVATDDEGEVHPLRKCFIAEEGSSLVLADYSQQEPRITAEYSQDPYLIDFILHGDGDSHSLVSSMISEYLLGTPIKVTKKNNPLVSRFNLKIRDVGKKLNLGLDYGKTAYSVKDDLDTTQQEAQKLLDIIASKTPKKQEYFQKWINFVKKNGYIIIDFVTNRRCWFSQYDDYVKLEDAVRNNRDKKIYSEYSKVKGTLERFSRNYRIQGSGGSMTKLAAVYFYQEMDKRNWLDDVYLVNLVHDELDIESKNEYKDEVAKIASDYMIKAGEKFCKIIPMKAEPIISDCWNKT
jgi:DNA polymerase-1